MRWFVKVFGILDADMDPRGAGNNSNSLRWLFFSQERDQCPHTNPYPAICCRRGVMSPLWGTHPSDPVTRRTESLQKGKQTWINWGLNAARGAGAIKGSCMAWGELVKVWAWKEKNFPLIKSSSAGVAALGVWRSGNGWCDGYRMCLSGEKWEG